MVQENDHTLTALRASGAQERLATIVVACLSAIFIAVLPFRTLQLPQETAFIPVTDSIMLVIDVITAVLLYTYFSVTRIPGLLVLAAGYLFTGLVMVPHLLSFPGATSLVRLPRTNTQSAGWIFFFWRNTLPLSVTAYVLLGRLQVKHVLSLRLARTGIVVSVSLVFMLIVLTTLLATRYAHLLPIIIIGDRIVHSYLGALILLNSLAALYLVWRWRATLLDVVLTIVLWAWLIETLLIRLSNTRFCLGWYSGRTFGVLASFGVLLALVYESTLLHARLASTMALRERDLHRHRLTLEVLVSSIAHDLRQPLSAIEANGSAATHLLQQVPPDISEAREALEDMVLEGRRANEILVSTQVTLAGSVRPLVPVDLEELVRETLTLLRLELQAHQVSVHVSATGAVPRVLGNRPQLQQVLANVITNAFESMASVTHRARVLTIGMSASSPERVCLVMQDSGTGITSEQLDRVFEPLYTTKPHGTGLGLAICQAIIETHGGEISLTPGRTHGSILQIVLPSVADAAPGRRQPAPPS